MIEISTHSDALRHTAKPIMVAVSMTAAMSLVSTLVLLGTDMDASVRIGYVVTSSLLIGVGSRRRSTSQAIDLPSDGGVKVRSLITGHQHPQHLFATLARLAET